MVVSSLLMYRVPQSRKVEKVSSDGKDKKVALTWESATASCSTTT